jgi:hypothetical protein
MVKLISTLFPLQIIHESMRISDKLSANKLLIENNSHSLTFCYLERGWRQLLAIVSGGVSIYSIDNEHLLVTSDILVQ